MTDTKEETQTTAVVEPTVHPAIELLLARMKSNPDEFYPKGHRWHKLIGEYSGHFTEAEHVAINEGLREIAMDAFHVAVMNELLCDPEEANEAVRINSGGNVGMAGLQPGAWRPEITTTLPYNPYNNTASGITGIRASQISALNAQTQQDQYNRLLQQMNSAQQAYSNNTPILTPADTTKSNGWLGGLF